MASRAFLQSISDDQMASRVSEEIQFSRNYEVSFFVKSC